MAREREMVARDSYRSVVALAILGVSWDLVATILGAPLSRSFADVRAMLGCFGFAGLVYAIWTWRHPRLRFALIYTIIVLVGVALIIPWIAWLAAPAGDQWRPVATAQLVIAAVPLIVPPLRRLSYVLLAAFSGVLLVVLAYQQHAGVGPHPAGEPFTSLCISVLALAVLLLRHQRQRIGLAYIRTQSEASALASLTPLVNAIADALAGAIRASDSVSSLSDTMSRAFSRSIHRLDTLRDRLDALRAPAPELVHDRDETRRLHARDQHLGALIFALAGFAVLAMARWGLRGLPLGLTQTFLTCTAILSAGIALWLWLTRRHPTITSGVLASVLLLVTGSLLAAYVHVYWVRMDVPAFPCVAPKLLLMSPVLLCLPRLSIGVLFIAVTTVVHVFIQLHVASQLPPYEPWHTLMFAVIGLGFLLMGEQRRIASIALLRAEAHASSLHRRANLSLALCDQLNTPLQSLMVILETLPPSASSEEASLRVDQLRTLSQELTARVATVPRELHHFSLDGALELERRS